MQVAAAVQQVIGSSPDSHQPLMEAGLDSLGAVELRNALSSAFAVELPATVTLDYPSIAALSTYVASLQPASPMAENAAPQPELRQLGRGPQHTQASSAQVSCKRTNACAPSTVSGTFRWHSFHRRQTKYQQSAMLRYVTTQQHTWRGLTSSSVLQAAMEDQVASIVASVLGSQVAPSQPLMEAGLDSLGPWSCAMLYQLHLWCSCPLQ